MRIALALLLLMLPPLTKAGAFTPSANASHFQSAGISSRTIFAVTGNTPQFFMSFWYNLPAPPYLGGAILTATNISNDIILNVTFIADRSSPVLAVHALNENKNCLNASTLNVKTMPFDGEWHNVVLEIFDVSLTAGKFARAQIPVDGVIQEMDESLQYVFGNFDWKSVTQWEVGDGYLGDLAELYVDLDGNLLSGPLTDIIVSQFYDAETGLAPGLGGLEPEGVGLACRSPSGIVPNMCNRGEPCSFYLGPIQSMGPPITFWYLLRPDIVQGVPLLQQAASDPCKFTNDGQGADGYVPGSGCPAAAHP